MNVPYLTNDQILVGHTEQVSHEHGFSWIIIIEVASPRKPLGQEKLFVDCVPHRMIRAGAHHQARANNTSRLAEHDDSKWADEFRALAGAPQMTPLNEHPISARALPVLGNNRANINNNNNNSDTRRRSEAVPEDDDNNDGDDGDSDDRLAVASAHQNHGKYTLVTSKQSCRCRRSFANCNNF